MFEAFPVSLYIDFSARIKNCSKWIKTFLYAGFGSLAGLLGSVVLYDLFPILSMLIFGMVGGVIHYFILALIKRLSNSNVAGDLSGGKSRTTLCQ